VRNALVARRTFVVVLLAITGCAAATTRPPASDPSDPPAGSVGMPADSWAAVLDTAADPGRLTTARRDTLAALGDVLEGSVVISPGACLDGLPASFRDGYVLALVRPGREDVLALASQLSQEPSFVGEVTIVCSD
jgi:hypothetical protein